MDQSCAIVDWIVTVIFTAIALIVWALPKRRLHPFASLWLAFLFFNYVFQYYFLQFGVSALQSTGHSELITLLIPLMSLFATLLLWLLASIAEFIVMVLVVMMIAQTSNLAISMPIAFALAIGLAIILKFTPVNSIRHQVVVGIFASADVIIGISVIILQTSTAIDDLPNTCLNHFNMMLTCDVTCGAVENYTQPGVRVGLVVAWALLFVIRWIIIASCTSVCIDPPKQSAVFWCCGCVDGNDDRWVDVKNDSKYPLLAVDTDEGDTEHDADV